MITDSAITEKENTTPVVDGGASMTSGELIVEACQDLAIGVG